MSVATSVDETFMTMVEPLRGELTAHCYRMLGSVHDAEDLVQETYLRAWKAYHNFENRSSVRTWMYQIATNACLSALGSKHRRTLPTGVGQPSGPPTGDLAIRQEVAWLEPLPDSVVWQRAAEDPGDEVVSRESVRLAFVAALQHLTPPQRAVLILRDVLAWQASEVAAALDLSVAAVNSSLQRARAHLAKLDPDADRPARAAGRPAHPAAAGGLRRRVRGVRRRPDHRAAEGRRGLGDAAVHRLVPGRRGDPPADLELLPGHRSRRPAPGAGDGQRPTDVRAVHAR